MLLVYSLSLLVIYMAGRKESVPYRINHSGYCIFLAKGIMKIIQYFTISQSYQKSISVLYGNKNIDYMNKWQISLKISSCILFISLPITIISVSKSNDNTLLLFLFLLMVVGYTLPDIDLTIKAKKKQEEILYDFARFTYRLSLYLNSGLTIYQALKMSVDKNSQSYFNRQINKVILKSEAGSIFVDELIGFSNMINMNEINSLVTIITQNIQNGGRAKEKIENYSKEMWNIRKNEAIKAGEKASVKMVFPLTLGLIGVIIIIITPAILLIKQI